MGLGDRSGLVSRVHAKARSREVPMSEGQFFARALGPRRWSRFSTKAIRGDSRRPPGGPGCQANAPGRGRPVGPGSWGACLWDKQLLWGGWILGNDDDSLLLLADNYIQQLRNEPRSAETQRRFRGNSRQSPA